MKELIIPDVHTRIDVVKRILDRYSGTMDRIIFLGDWFDDFGAGPEKNRQVAVFLKNLMETEDYTFLWGNHDLHYRYPIPGILCSGFLKGTYDAVNTVMEDHNWSRFQLFTRAGENAYLVSHAGFHPNFAHPTEGFSFRYLTERENECMMNLNAGKFDMLVGAGRARGGRQAYGGCVWLDWNYEFEPIENLNQIVGHTVGGEVRTKIVPNSSNYCIDTNSRHIAIVEDGNVQTIGV